MKVIIRNEAGYEEALYGLSLSFKDREIPYKKWWVNDRKYKMKKISEAQHKRDGGHNKFLESIMVWVEVEAPRGWWQEFDTYRVGVTKQSDSTMHTIQRRPLHRGDFTEGTDDSIIERFNEILEEATDGFEDGSMLTGDALQVVKWNIPEGFLQNRMVCLNYKTLRNIFLQRKTHRLKQWQIFIDEVRTQCEHPELLPE